MARLVGSPFTVLPTETLVVGVTKDWLKPKPIKDCEGSDEVLVVVVVLVVVEVLVVVTAAAARS